MEASIEEAVPTKKRVRRRGLQLRPDIRWWMTLGVVVVATGVGLVTYAWLRVATLISVQLQLPYVVSSALGGLATVLIGLGIVDLASRRRDARDRTRELRQLGDLLGGIADSLPGSAPPAAASEEEGSS